MSSPVVRPGGFPWRSICGWTALAVLVSWVVASQATLSRMFAQLATLPSPSWWAILLAIGAVVASYCCSAVALSAAAGRRLPFGRTLLVQFAAAAANRVTPGGVGGMAVNARYLRAQTLSTGAVGAALSLSATAHLVIAVLGVLIMGPSVTKLPIAHSMIATRIHGVPLIVPAVGAVGLAVWWISCVARSRSRADRRVARTIEDARGSLSTAVGQPKRLALLFTATAGVKITNLLALLAATWAFDGDVGNWRVVLVYLVGVPVAEALPTPGGFGAVDAMLVASLARDGSSTAGAVVASVIVFRLLTFWAPILPGVLSAGVLRRRHAL